jgi:hypothetical protein
MGAQHACLPQAGCAPAWQPSSLIPRLERFGTRALLRPSGWRYIFSGASIPINPNAFTNCASTNSVNANKNARFCSSASDKI